MEIVQLYNIFQECSSVTTDSRNIQADCLFFALKGENFNGNHFALEAIGKGAAYAIVADVYRPLSSNDVAEFQPFRGNIFTKYKTDTDGKLARNAFYRDWETDRKSGG